MVPYSAFFQPTVGKGWYSSYPGDSCKDIYDSGDARGDGEYWIDPEKNGNPLKVFCDMTRAGGEYWCSIVITERTYTLRSGYKMDDRAPGYPDPEIRRGPGLKKNFFLAHRASVSSKGNGGGRGGAGYPGPPWIRHCIVIKSRKFRHHKHVCSVWHDLSIFSWRTELPYALWYPETSR